VQLIEKENGNLLRCDINSVTNISVSLGVTPSPLSRDGGAGGGRGKMLLDDCTWFIAQKEVS
jgi:hypothetical protein